MTADRPVLVWFRNDLRLADHPALTEAVSTGAPVVPVFVLDDHAPGDWRPGGASRWWLHHSLERLADDVRARGSRLVLRRGRTEDVLAGLAGELGAVAVYCSRAYEPWARRLEEGVHKRLSTAGTELKRFAGALLHEPDRLVTKSGTPFKVFTPFFRALRPTVGMKSLPAPKTLRPAPQKLSSDALDEWKLLPTRPDWAGGLREAWQPGEAAARQRLEDFLGEDLAGYAAGRDRPDRDATSRLSPHLHFGELSPRTVWTAAATHAGRAGNSDRGLEVFLSELAWREFSYHLLFHCPNLPEHPIRAEFGNFPWGRRAGPTVAAWQRGQTGYPIVDAGMRQLWATGWMHNRVRMIVASFLIKHLLVPWQVGEAWFWDTLVDADLASNAASWQWVAGCGADAAPYFRIFNPVLQGEKFDPAGDYVRHWVPELARMPAVAIHAPWQAKPDVLRAAGVALGSSYPAPIVDHRQARAKALAAFDALRATGRATP